MDDMVDYKGGKLSEIVINSIKPFLGSIKEKGIKKSIENLLPGVKADDFVLSKIRNQLVKRREIELGKGLGRAAVQYRFDGIQIEFSGLVKIFINKITITDEQIIKSFNSIIDQIYKKYICNDLYLIEKIDDIVCSFSKTEIYKPKNSEEKTLYDLAMLVLINYYKSDFSENRPLWIEGALKNIESGKFIKKWIDILAEYISEVISEVSKEVFFDFKMTIDSFLIRTFLNKKTNRGQISQLLSMVDIDVKDIIYKFAKSYVSPSFIRGASEILSDIVGNLLNSCGNDFMEKSEEVFNITMTLGETAECDRNFRWFTSDLIKECRLEYSYDKDFKDKVSVFATCKRVPQTVPILNLWLISNYKIIFLNKFSAKIKNLKPGTVYYRIVNSEKVLSPVYKININKAEENLKFMVFADSQGMVKNDYEVFSKVLESAYKKEKCADFMVHLGDFVDNGNNEEYWKWVLESNVWRKTPTVALSGNHEALLSAVGDKYGVEHSVNRHFNLENPIFKNNSMGAYYSFVYKNATFIVLNTNEVDENDELDKIQYKWALNTALKAKTKWKILLTHKSPYSNGPHHKDPDVKKTGKQIANLSYYGKIDLVIGGHDHVYARTPFLVEGLKIDNKNETKDGVCNSYVNPMGTMFVTPGTSGVKNYKQHFPIDFFAEKILNIKNPVYSCVEIKENQLYFKSYEFDSDSMKFNTIDSFLIEKKEILQSDIDAVFVSKIINSIPDMPWIDNSVLIFKAFEYYKKLEYSEKVKVLNYCDLLEKFRMNSSFKKIQNSEIRIVKNKKEFMHALKDLSVGTIVTKCSEINLGKKFLNKNIVIDRDLCITGEARISNVKLTVKEKGFLILSGNVCIDNNRKPMLFSFSGNIIELEDYATFILNGNATINGGYAVGNKGYGVNAKGENCSVYLNSSGYNFVNNGVVFAPNPFSKVVVNSGKYFSLGGHPTLNVNGILNVKGGFIRSIKGYVDSLITINAGIVGENNRPEYQIPIELFGRAEFLGGTIQDRNGISVLVHGTANQERVTICGNYVDIKGKLLYN